ncbi:MAG: methyltransferase FkbM [Flavobacteriales bacterium]|nr:methyltransferase FkbM [Flavobacteriales bacterium]
MNIGKGSFNDESGEENAIRYINKQFDGVDDLMIFDVGANVGHYSILLNKHIGEKAMIHAFEPSKRTFDKLQSNVGDLNNIVPHNFGLGNEQSKQTLYTNTEGSGLASVYKRNLDHINIDMNQSEDIVISTLDSFCDENKISHIHFLKLDVEGHELKVLEGAAKMLRSASIDFIQFEFGGCNIDSRTYFQDFYYLLKDNFNLYRIVKDGLFPISRYSEMYEAFSTTNYLAERK